VSTKATNRVFVVTPTKFSISAVSRITGLSRPTIARHIKSKPISFEINELGHTLIDHSELLRVYGDRCNFVREEKRGQHSATLRSETSTIDQRSPASALQDQLIQRYAEENEHLKLALDKALDYQNSVMKLLEDRSKHDSEKWQAALDAMSNKLANLADEQIEALRESHEQELLRLKRALQREAKKTWLDKLFEKKRAGARHRT
jgi:hypothetical protein